MGRKRHYRYVNMKDADQEIDRLEKERKLWLGKATDDLNGFEHQVFTHSAQTFGKARHLRLELYRAHRKDGGFVVLYENRNAVEIGLLNDVYHAYSQRTMDGSAFAAPWILLLDEAREYRQQTYPAGPGPAHEDDIV